MAITGVHALLYSPQADAVRALLRDVMGWTYVEDSPGWLIFKLPPAELGVHPTMGDDDVPHHELSLMCDDVVATAAELSAKGVEVKGEPQDMGFGVVVTLVLPGGVEVLLYEPRHTTAI
jgi:hypothetical protein